MDRQSFTGQVCIIFTSNVWIFVRDGRHFKAFVCCSNCCLPLPRGLPGHWRSVRGMSYSRCISTSNNRVCTYIRTYMCCDLEHVFICVVLFSCSVLEVGWEKVSSITSTVCLVTQVLCCHITQFVCKRHRVPPLISPSPLNKVR